MFFGTVLLFLVLLCAWEVPPALLLKMEFKRLPKSVQGMSGLLDEGILMIEAKDGIALIGTVEVDVAEVFLVVFQAAFLDAFKNECCSLKGLGDKGWSDGREFRCFRTAEDFLKKGQGMALFVSIIVLAETVVVLMKAGPI